MIKNKKQLIAGLFISFALLFPVNAIAQPLKMNASVISEFANIREEPGDDKKIITSVKKDTVLQITGTNENKDWYKVRLENSRTGWVSKASLKTSVTGNLDYKVASNLGTPNEQGVLNEALKVSNNGYYTYVIDNLGKYNINIYDLNNNFLESHDLNYPWIGVPEDKDNIVLASDEKFNFYTNNEERNALTIYDFNGNKVTKIKSELLGNLTQIYYDNQDRLLYTLDDSSKNIRVFDSTGKHLRNIFLSDTKVPKKFTVKNGRIYVLDYPETETTYTPVYYVDSYSFSFRESPLRDATVTENLSKGSIIKFEENLKTFPERYLLEDNVTTKVQTWLEFTSGDKKQYALREDIQKVDTIGEVDIYTAAGEPVNTVSLNNKWVLSSPDRHREFGNIDIVRRINGILVDENDNLIIPVITSEKKNNTKRFNLNYYYLNLGNNTYKISKSLPFAASLLPDAAVSGKDVLTINTRGYIDVLDENGLEKERLGRISPHRFNMPAQLRFSNNRLFVFDKGNYSFGEYDLNGEALRTRSIDQSTDLFKWDDVFFAERKLVLLKTLQSEEKKLGLEIFDYSLNNLADKWLLTIDSGTVPKLGVSSNNEIFVLANGDYFGKRVAFSMFDEKFRLLNSWKQESDINNVFAEDFMNKLNSTGTKILGFNKKGQIYLLVLYKTSNYKIHKIDLSREGRATILNTLDPDFFAYNVTVPVEGTNKTEVQRIFNGINGEILKIEEGKNGFTYMLYRPAGQVPKLGVYDPSGAFWKEFSLREYPRVKSFTLDENENLWITEGSNILKFETN